ncbi:hypothetical protein LguiA_034841 [Lonicera macranthoides]
MELLVVAYTAHAFANTVVDGLDAHTLAFRWPSSGASELPSSDCLGRQHGWPGKALEMGNNKDIDVSGDNITEVETEYDKSVARTDIVPYKSHVPSIMFQIGLSTLATNNVRASYAFMNMEQLRVAVKKDSDLLNKKFHVLSLREKVMAEALVSVVAVAVTHKNSGIKKKGKRS